MIKRFFANLIQEQLASHSNTKPEYRWAEGRFFLNCEAGLISFKPKTDREAARFRDAYINRFDSICTDWQQGKKVRRQFFKLFREIRSKEKVKYKANFRTRIVGNLCAV